MGWWGLHREPGVTHAEFFRERFSYKDSPEAGLVDIKGAGFGTAYAAVRHPKGYVFAVVIQMRWSRDAEHNFYYRADDESVGPVRRNCPQSILDQLTPDEELIDKWSGLWGADGYWRQWREDCRKNLSKRKKLPSGSILKFSHTFSFSNGEERDTFELNRERTYRGGTRVVFTPPGSTFPRYQIKGWRQLEYEVIENPPF